MNFRTFLIKNKDVTIISNNCFAGMFYKHYGLKFNSPTIGLFIRSSEYIKFLECLPQIVGGGYTLTEKATTEVQWPVGILHVNQSNKDIEINFMHYKSFKEAEIKWKRRISRIDLEHAIIFFMHTPFLINDDLKRYESIQWGNKILAYDKTKFGGIKDLKNVECYTTDAFHWEPEFSWDFPVMLKDTGMKQIVNNMINKSRKEKL